MLLHWDKHGHFFKAIGTNHAQVGSGQLAVGGWQWQVVDCVR